MLLLLSVLGMASVDHEGKEGLTVVVTPPAAPTPPVAPAARATARSAARVAAARVTATARHKRARQNGRGGSNATEPSKRRARSEATPCETFESHETTTE